MPAVKEGPLLDRSAGRLIRPYTVSGGRTWPTASLDLLTLVMATGSEPPARSGPEHAQAMGLCRGPISVAEIAAHLGVPVTVAKILLSDLVDCGAVAARPPDSYAHPTDRSLLEAVLDGLRRQL
ncbi:DUF742 domain-containing protein [Streptomyces sp. NPDC001840]